MGDEVVKSSEVTKRFVFAGLGILLIIIGFILTPNMNDVMSGYSELIKARFLLDPNAFMLAGGHLGVPFINSGLLVLCVVFTYALAGTDINGGQIAAMFMVLGFGFCGKTILNVWPFIGGVILHAIVNKKEIKSVMNIAWFSCALTPIFNIVAFYLRFDGPARAEYSFNGGFFVLAIIMGVIAGYGVAFFAGILPLKHDGFLLFNVGFAAGMTGFLIHAILKACGMGNSAPDWVYPNIGNGVLSICIAVVAFYLIICGLIICKGKGISKIFSRRAKGGDHVVLIGFGPSLVNMGVVCLLCLGYLAVAGMMNSHDQIGNLSGPVFSALFTVTGFASNGITVKTVIPIYLGVFLTSIVTGGIAGAIGGASFLQAGWDYAGTKSMLIAALYACGMSPIAGEYGPLSGFVAGCIHCVIVPNVAALHGWFNLYNNGFGAGIVATFFRYIAEVFKEKKPEEANAA